MKVLITAAQLRQLLHYDPLTGHFTWLVRRNQHSPVGGRAGHVHEKNGYRYINVCRGMYLAHRLAWLYMTGEWPANDTDHERGNRDDNRWEMLRQLTRTQNMQNLQGPHHDNKTGLLGVSPSRGKFAAHIRFGGKNRYLGTFDTAEQASAVYRAAKAKHHAGWAGRKSQEADTAPAER